MAGDGFLAAGETMAIDYEAAVTVIVKICRHIDPRVQRVST
jgi:hypothetical protein